MKPDPLPVLRVFGVRFELGDAEYTIEKRPAADWFEAIRDGDLFAVLLDASSADRIALDRGRGIVSDDKVRAVQRQIVSDAAGRNWWEVHRLVHAGAGASDLILGSLINDGFDFEHRSIGAYCAAVVARVTEHMDKKERDRFVLDLATAPVEVAAEEGDEALSAAFLAAMGEVS